MKKRLKNIMKLFIMLLLTMVGGATLWTITLIVQHSKSVIVHFLNIPLIGFLGFLFGIFSLSFSYMIVKKIPFKKDSNVAQKNNIFVMPPNLEELRKEDSSKKEA